MARSSFYYQIKKAGEPDGYEQIRKRIRKIYCKHHRRYGYRRITMELNAEGIKLNHKTVQKLMQGMGLHGLQKKRRYNSFRGRIGDVAPNVINRMFKTDAPCRKWTTDVTQVCIHDKITYLSPILDMYNGEIVAYTISRSPSLEMVMSMLNKSLKKHPDTSGLILHSDQGWHYQHPLYQKALKKHGIIQSMSRKGTCLDNAIMENFFGIMKNELLYLRSWDSIEQFERALRVYIKYYNNERIKLRLNGMSPVRYRAQFQ